MRRPDVWDGPVGRDLREWEDSHDDNRCPQCGEPALDEEHRCAECGVNAETFGNDAIDEAIEGATLRLDGDQELAILREREGEG